MVEGDDPRIQPAGVTGSTDLPARNGEGGMGSVSRGQIVEELRSAGFRQFEAMAGNQIPDRQASLRPNCLISAASRAVGDSSCGFETASTPLDDLF